MFEKEKWCVYPTIKVSSTNRYYCLTFNTCQQIRTDFQSQGIPDPPSVSLCVQCTHTFRWPIWFMATSGTSVSRKRNLNNKKHKLKLFTFVTKRRVRHASDECLTAFFYALNVWPYLVCPIVRIWCYSSLISNKRGEI